MNTAKYTLVDCATDLPYGPFHCLDQARHCAENGNIKKWEIINRAGDLIDWSPTPLAVLTATERAA